MDFWFDDGWAEDFTRTRPFLKEIGHRGIFAIVTGWVGNWKYMDMAQLKKLIEEGHKIASHGTDHKLMKDMDLAETERVLKDSKEWICKNLGVEPYAFVPPWCILRSDQSELAFKYYENVRPGIIMHFHSPNFPDILNTIPRYIKGPCPVRATIRRRRHDASLTYAKQRFGCGFSGV